MLLDRWRRFINHELWFRPTLASVFSVGVAGAALYLGKHLDYKVRLDVGEDSLISLFTIFASSMLSVATFTVSAIVTAAATASTTTTPRASQFILSDSKAQLVLSAFIAAFIYSVIGILALKIFDYGPFGRFLLFAGLIVIVVFVLVSFINWVDHAMKLGLPTTTIAKLSTIAMESTSAENCLSFSAKQWLGHVPDGSAPMYLEQFGYLVAVDLPGLQAVAQDAGCELTLAVRPGDYCEPTRPFAYVSPGSALNGSVAEAIRSNADVAPIRSERYDIRFNLINLTETADRALSPGVNDPGTAIQVLNEQLRVLCRWAEQVREHAGDEPIYDRVAIAPLTADELVNDAFTPIARDGAGSVEVGVRLQKVLGALTRQDLNELTVAARSLMKDALAMSDAALVLETHKQRLRLASEQQTIARASAPPT